MFWAGGKGRNRRRRRKYAPNVVLFSFSERPLSRPILRRSFYTSQECISAIPTFSLESKTRKKAARGLTRRLQRLPVRLTLRLSLALVSPLLRAPSVLPSLRLSPLVLIRLIMGPRW